MWWRIAIFLLLFQTISLLYAHHSPPNLFYYVYQIPDGVINLCSDYELCHHVQQAASEWNTAIKYFGIRFLWLDVMGLEFNVRDSECDVYVVKSTLHQRIRALTDLSGDTAYILVNESLEPENTASVIAHELGHVLGLDEVYSRGVSPAPIMNPTGVGRVTSHDIYALVEARRRTAGGEPLPLIIQTPSHLPYIAVYEPTPEIVSAILAVTTAYFLDRFFKNHVKRSKSKSVV